MTDHPFVPGDVQDALGRRYVVGPEVAVGGQGAVFKAKRASRPDGTLASDVVALKLHIYPGQDIRVQREVTAMQTISHPNLPRVIEHGYCEVAGKRTLYVAWEFIEGQPLSERLKAGRMLESEVLAMGRDVASAIAAIWSRRIVHGDIKPSNIILRDSGGAALIDLGAARHLEQDNSPAARRPFGTAGYFSPEQARGEKVLTSASDIFSLGIVMLQSLIGRHPTEYHQSGLAHGFRASDVRFGATTALLCTLDKMLSERPQMRPTPASLSNYFQRLQDKMEADFAQSARSAQSADD